MRLGIFGTGYAGLVTAVGLAEVGHTVTAIDKDPDIVARLSDGTPTIHEPGLQELLTANLEAGKLRFSTQAEDAMSASNIIFLCVGTPPRADGRADLSQVEEVARTIAQQLDGYKLIVEKSTVPARTAQWVTWTIRRLAGPQHEFDVASNPEFLREGSAVHDFMRPDRIVIGADSQRARSLLVDRLLTKIERALWIVRHKVVAVLGVSFKGNTDDIRGAPSLTVVPRLHDAGASLRIYDPAAMPKLQAMYPPDDRLVYAESAIDAARGANALVILTDWEEFRRLDLDRLRSVMRSPIIIDGRNLFRPAQLEAAGFEYYSLGRGDVTPGSNGHRGCT